MLYGGTLLYASSICSNCLQHLYMLGGRNGNVALRDFWRYSIGKICLQNVVQPSFKLFHFSQKQLGANTRGWRRPWLLTRSHHGCFQVTFRLRFRWMLFPKYLVHVFLILSKSFWSLVRCLGEFTSYIHGCRLKVSSTTILLS